MYRRAAEEILRTVTGAAILRFFCGVVICLVLLNAGKVQAGAVKVVDEVGNPIDNFEIMWHTAQNGYCLWTPVRNGIWNDDTRSYGNVIDLIVRADGYATTVQRFEGESLQSLRSGKATIVLNRGREVIIEMRNLPSPIPDDFVMESFFPEFASRVQMMWQPVNIRDEKKPDWNMLNVRKIDDTHFSVRISDNTGDFLLAIQHPGWLQFCKFEPFVAAEIKGTTLQLDLPTPAKLEDFQSLFRISAPENS